MECKKVKDRLMTEYLDKELGSKERVKVDQHLTECMDCREFFEAVRKTSVIPFEGTGEMRPDGIVWEKITERLESQKAHTGNEFWIWLDRIASWRPLPVMRVAFATALILMVMVLAKWPSSYTDPVYGYVSEQRAFMGELRVGNTDFMKGDLKDYESAFENISR